MFSGWTDKLNTLKELTAEALDGGVGEELDAAQMELDEANAKIEELRSQLQAKTQETQLLTHKCEDLQNKLGAEELVRDELAREYKKNLQQRDDELTALRRKNKELYGQMSNLNVSSAPSQSASREISNISSQNTDELTDITEVINSDMESNRLTGQLSALQSKLNSLVDERHQVLGLMEGFGVFNTGDELGSVSRSDRLVSVVQFFVQRCEDSVLQAKTAVSEMASENDKLKEHLAAQAQQIEQLVQRHQELRVLSEHESQTSESSFSADSTNLIAQLQTEKSELMAALEKARKDKQLARQKIEKLVSEKAMLIEELQKEKDASKGEQERVQEQITQLSQQIHQAGEQRAQKEVELNSLKSAYLELEAVTDSLKRENEDLKKVQKETAKLPSTEESFFVSLLSEQSGQKSTGHMDDKLAAEHQALKDQAEQQQRINEELERDRQRLQQQLQEVSMRYEAEQLDKNKKLASLESRVAELQDQLQQSKVTQKSIVPLEIDKLRKECGELKSNLEEQNQFREQLEDSLNKAQRLLEEASLSHSACATEKAKFTQTISELQISMAQYEKQIQDFQSQFDAQRLNESHLQSEVAQLRAALQKSHDDLERLRAHLIETEESREQIDFETERKVKSLEQQLASALTREEELQKVIQQSSDVLEQNEQLQRELRTKTQAMENLQSVVEQLQSEQDNRTEAEIAYLNKQLQLAKQEVAALTEKLKQAEIVESQKKIVEEKVATLEPQMEIFRKENEQLKQVAASVKTAFEEALKKLGKREQDEENYVDKRLVKKLILTYLDRNSKKHEVLELIARIVNFTEDEKVKAGMVKSSRWSLVPKFLSGTPKEANGAGAQKSGQPNFTDLWVEYLLKEAEGSANPQQSKVPPSENVTMDTTSKTDSNAQVLATSTIEHQ